jgi:hypothetical protein
MRSYDSLILLPPWFYPAVLGYYFYLTHSYSSYLSWHEDIRLSSQACSLGPLYESKGSGSLGTVSKEQELVPWGGPKQCGRSA